MNEKLTQQMIADFLPFVTDKNQFTQEVAADVELFGNVNRIEQICDSNGQVKQKLYYFEKAQCFHYTLYAHRCGLDSLPE